MQWPSCCHFATATHVTLHPPSTDTEIFPCRRVDDVTTSICSRVIAQSESTPLTRLTVKTSFLTLRRWPLDTFPRLSVLILMSRALVAKCLQAKLSVQMVLFGWWDFLLREYITGSFCEIVELLVTKLLPSSSILSLTLSFSTAPGTDSIQTCWTSL